MGQQFGKTWVGTLVSANVLDFACSFLRLFTLVCLPVYLHNSPFVCLTPRLSASQVGTVARQVSREEYGQGRGDGWMDGCNEEGGKWEGWIDETVCLSGRRSVYINALEHIPSDRFTELVHLPFEENVEWSNVGPVPSLGVGPEWSSQWESSLSWVKSHQPSSKLHSPTICLTYQSTFPREDNEINHILETRNMKYWNYNNHRSCEAS